MCSVIMKICQLNRLIKAIQAVSYTHLDVYKRQTQMTVLCVVTIQTKFIHHTQILIKPVYIRSVSYTHLDVYKRQIKLTFKLFKPLTF